MEYGIWSTREAVVAFPVLVALLDSSARAAGRADLDRLCRGSTLPCLTFRPGLEIGVGRASEWLERRHCRSVTALHSFLVGAQLFLSVNIHSITRRCRSHTQQTQRRRSHRLSCRSSRHSIRRSSHPATPPLSLASILRGAWSRAGAGMIQRGVSVF